MTDWLAAGHFRPGIELLSDGHEGRHLRPPEPNGLHGAHGVSFGQRWLSTGDGRPLPDDAQCPWRYALPPGRRTRLHLLRRFRVTGGHPGR